MKEIINEYLEMVLELLTVMVFITGFIKAANILFSFG